VRRPRRRPITTSSDGEEANHRSRMDGRDGSVLRQAVRRILPLGAPSSPPKVDTGEKAIVAEAAGLLEGGKPQEHDKFRHNSVLYEAYVVLSRGHVEHGLTLQDLVLSARLAERIKLWAEARRWWDACLNHPETDKRAQAQALAGIIRADRNEDRHEEVNEFLATQPPELRAAKPVIKEVQRLESDFLMRRAMQLGHRARLSIVQNDVSEASRSLREALRHSGTPCESEGVLAEFVAGLVSVLHPESNASHRTSADPSPWGWLGWSPLQRPVILVSGFGWSGSGAVVDYLREVDGVHLAFARPELSCFEANPPTTSARQVLDAHRDGEDWRAALVDFVLTSVVGVSFPVEDVRSHGRLREKSLLGHLGRGIESADRVLTATTALLAAIRQQAAPSGRVPGPEVVAAFRTFFSYTLALALQGEQEQQRLLLDNAMHAYNFDLLAVMPDVDAIAVLRDPRDQFVSRAMEKDPARRDLWSIENFVRSRSRLMEKFELACADLPSHSRLLPVSFESFVSDEAARLEVLAHVGVSRPAETRPRHFIPESSARNVGIHRSFRELYDFRELERALPNYLFEDS
jgi:hypothetical protein